jgi:V/A-type H+/Na+-transporting ATPase subunit C
MEAVREYGYINAKVRAMRSRFLTESAYRSLASARDSKELAGQLGATRYKDAFQSVLGGFQSAEAVEQALERAEITELRAIEKFSQSDSKKMVQTLLERYDAEALKAVLRLWHAKMKPSEPFPAETAAQPIPFDAVLAAQSIGQIGQLLEGTAFHESVIGSAAAYEEKKTLFPVELAIDRSLFSRIWEAGMALNGHDRTIVRGLVGIEIDLKNLDWISRFRNYYKVPFAEIGDMLLENGSRLNAESLRKMASEGRMADAFTRVLRGTGVSAPEADSAASQAQVGAMERFLSHVLLSEANRAFRGNPLSIGSILGYFYCLRIETRNLRTLFTGKRYGLTAQQLEPLLIW